MKRLIPKSKIKSTSQRITDSLKYRKSRLTDKAYDLLLYSEARDVYLSWEPFRKTRLRNIRYVFGDQWGDIVKDDDGKLVTERQRIAKRTGGVVLQNNNMFKVVNGMSGIYVKSRGVPVVYGIQEDSDKAANMMTNAMQTNYENNEMTDLMTSELVEMLVGGMPIVSEEWANLQGKDDAYTLPIDPGYFAFRHKGADPRLWDTDLIVEIRDYTLGEIKTEFAKSNEDMETLDTIYAPYLNLDYPDIPTDTDLKNGANWDMPPRKNLCRTYRVWTQEYKLRYRVVDKLDFEQPIYRIDKEDKPIVDLIRKQRIEEYRRLGIEDETDMILPEMEPLTDSYWHCTIFGPEGIIIDEFDAQDEHGQHPYTFTAHQLVNGKIYPFMSIVVDQQRYINRLITLQDLYINSAIKGLKMVPKSMLGGLTPRQFAKRAVEMGGWIFYEPDERFPSLAPTVIQTQSRDIGVSELLKVQLEQIDEITSFSSAARGAQPQSGTPASRYALETENAITSIAVIYDKFNHFENKLARKKLKVIHEHYTTGRDISVWHTSGLAEQNRYDAKLVEDLDFDVKVRQAPDTPVQRMTNNDLFKEMWLRGILNTEQLLKYSDLPGTEQLKQDLAAMQEQAQQNGQQPQQAAPQQLNEAATEAINKAANQDTTQAIQQALRQDLGSLTTVA